MPNAIAPSSDVLTVPGAARELRMSQQTVRRMCDGGELACTKTDGGHRRIPRAAVEALRDGRPYQHEANAA